MSDDEPHSVHERWARLRFAVIGPLLAAPPAAGELQTALRALAEQSWRHPVSGEPVRFAFSTLERWYYRALRAERDPVSALRPRRRRDAGRHRRLSPALCEVLHAQYDRHPAWSVQLHVDNLAVLVVEQPDLGPMPSYATIRRYLRAQGLHRRPGRRRARTPGMEIAERRLAEREVRSFELDHVNALWHADFHVGSRRVIDADGRWHKVHLLGILDDCSRLGCHVQWYRTEDVERLVHGLMQALQKRGLPRALMTDRGPAETAAEFTEGLLRLGIVHQPTLPYSAYQNAKQEVFWAQVEGRLLAMLDTVEALTLEQLNLATLAWLEREYHRTRHRELGATPLDRYLAGPDVARPCPGSEQLREAFRAQTTRRQRRSDGTCTVRGTRFEIPSRYRHLDRLTLQYARWDLSRIALCDPHTEQPVATLYPLDKSANAEHARRALETVNASDPVAPAVEKGEMAPLLRRLIADYAATGAPPAFLPFDTEDPL